MRTSMHQAKSMLKAAGLTVSPKSFETDLLVFVVSVEMYNGCRSSISYNKKTGTTQTVNLAAATEARRQRDRQSRFNKAVLAGPVCLN